LRDSSQVGQLAKSDKRQAVMSCLCDVASWSCPTYFLDRNHLFFDFFLFCHWAVQNILLHFLTLTWLLW